MSAGVIDKIMCLKDWYIQWRKTNEVKTGVKASEVFTLEMWEEFIQERAKRQENAPIIVKHEQGVAAPAAPAAHTTSTASRGLNMSYQVETKEIPKLPVNKLLKGKIFDDWHSSFFIKMCQAKLQDLLEDRYVIPDPSDSDYDDYKTKDDFLRYHLLTATLESNASLFINAKTTTDLQMYNKLLD
eukprot:7125728-Ditylum_brightwellii.AAC.1